MCIIYMKTMNKDMHLSTTDSVKSNIFLSEYSREQFLAIYLITFQNKKK